MKIEDNGIGLDNHDIIGENIKGWGLITMRERALAIGGSCKVESSNGAGTSIIVEVPI